MNQSSPNTSNKSIVGSPSDAINSPFSISKTLISLGIDDFQGVIGSSTALTEEAKNNAGPKEAGDYQRGGVESLQIHRLLLKRGYILNIGARTPIS